MALHIADPEVSQLMNDYVRMTGMTKTEALRRLLRVAVLTHEQKPKRRENFKAVALAIIKKNRKLHLPPQTKEEADNIFE